MASFTVLTSCPIPDVRANDFCGEIHCVTKSIPRKPEEQSTRPDPSPILSSISQQLAQLQVQVGNLEESICKRTIDYAEYLVKELYGNAEDATSKRLKDRLKTGLNFFAGGDKQLMVYVHPNELGFVEKLLAEEVKGNSVILESDSQLSIGECLIEDVCGGILTSIEEEIKRARQSLDSGGGL